jgi:hypothetical protein
MPSITWTATALASEARNFAGEVWRMVEAQHIAATLKLVDDAEEHAVLEAMVEQSKPALPAAVRRLDYLLATPFRYPSPRHGSRFRAPGEPGVFYGAFALRTAAAELGWWRWQFKRDSPELVRLPPVPHTAFRAAIAANGVDLRAPPLLADAALWTAQAYEATQALARLARDAGVQAIAYQSVRDPDRGGCLALLDAAGFAAPRPMGESQTWWLAVQPERVIWKRGAEVLSYRYG